MSDEVKAPEINPNPESLADLTDEQLEVALADADVNEEGDLGGDLEFGEAEEKDTDGEDSADEDAKEGEDDAEDEEKDPDGEDEDTDDSATKGDGDDDEASIPEAQREAMEQVLSRLDTMEAERDQLVAKLEKAEILRDRNAGKLGSLLQKMEKRDTQRADDSFEGDAEDDASTKPAKNAELEEELAEIRQDKISRSVNSAAQDFYRENIEFFETLEKEAGEEKSKAFQADLIERVTAANSEVGEEILSMSPKMAGKMAAAVIKSCFADMRVDLLSDFRKGASEKADKSRKAIRARKKGAAGTRSNKRPGTSTTKTKSLSQMSDKELDAALSQAATLGSFD